MFNAHAIAETLKNLLLALHEVGLENVLADGVACFRLEGFVKPGELVSDGLFLDENGPEATGRSESGNG